MALEVQKFFANDRLDVETSVPSSPIAAAADTAPAEVTPLVSAQVDAMSPAAPSAPADVGAMMPSPTPPAAILKVLSGATLIASDPANAPFFDSCPPTNDANYWTVNRADDNRSGAAHKKVTFSFVPAGPDFAFQLSWNDQFVRGAMSDAGLDGTHFDGKEKAVFIVPTRPNGATGALVWREYDLHLSGTKSNGSGSYALGFSDSDPIGSIISRADIASSGVWFGAKTNVGRILFNVSTQDSCPVAGE